MPESIVTNYDQISLPYASQDSKHIETRGHPYLEHIHEDPMNQPQQIIIQESSSSFMLHEGANLRSMDLCHDHERIMIVQELEHQPHVVISCFLSLP